HRPLLRRGHLHRDRLDPPHEGLPRAERLRPRAARARGVGDPDRDRRVRRPWRAARAARSEPRAAGDATLVIGVESVYRVAGTFVLRRFPAVVDPKNVSLVALSLAALVALAVAVVALRQPLAAPVREGRRLFDLVGWAAVLPQMLAALGTIFAAAGVGDRIAEL